MIYIMYLLKLLTSKENSKKKPRNFPKRKRCTSSSRFWHSSRRFFAVVEMIKTYFFEVLRCDFLRHFICCHRLRRRWSNSFYKNGFIRCKFLRKLSHLFFETSSDSVFLTFKYIAVLKLKQFWGKQFFGDFSLAFSSR